MDNVNSKLKKLKIKKYFAQYEYLHTELVETKYIFELYNKQFLEECYKNESSTSKKENLDEEKNTEKNTEKNAQENTQENTQENAQENAQENMQENAQENVHQDTDEEIKLRKLYRKLSLKTHPDKKDGNRILFEQVKDAYNKKDFIGLIIIASKLDIDIDEYIEDAHVLFDVSIDEMQKNIEQYKKTLAWNWGNASDEQKELLKKEFNL